jgi:hypothetical protein
MTGKNGPEKGLACFFVFILRNLINFWLLKFICMKTSLAIVIGLLFAIAAAAQNNNPSNPKSNNDQWNDKTYYQQNKPLYDAIIEMHKRRWIKNEDYLIRAIGDTIRPYTQAEWMRDSLMLANRNWENEADPWPASFTKKDVYDPAKNYKLDSARSNSAGRTVDNKIEGIPVGGVSLEKDHLNKHSGQDFLFIRDVKLMVS